MVRAGGGALKIPPVPRGRIDGARGGVESERGSEDPPSSNQTLKPAGGESRRRSSEFTHLNKPSGER